MAAARRRTAAPGRPSGGPDTQRAYLAHLALRAMSHKVSVRVERGRKPPMVGKLVRVERDHLPRFELKDGGSNLVFHFEHGLQVPLEDVTAIKREREA